MVTHTFKPSGQEAETEVSEFQDSLDSIMASAGTGPAELSRNTVNAHLFMHSLQRLPGCHTRTHTHAHAYVNSCFWAGKTAVQPRLAA